MIDFLSTAMPSVEPLSNGERFEMLGRDTQMLIVRDYDIGTLDLVNVEVAKALNPRNTAFKTLAKEIRPMVEEQTIEVATGLLNLLSEEYFAPVVKSKNGRQLSLNAASDQPYVDVATVVRGRRNSIEGAKRDKNFEAELPTPSDKQVAYLVLIGLDGKAIVSAGRARIKLGTYQPPHERDVFRMEFLRRDIAVIPVWSPDRHDKTLLRKRNLLPTFFKFHTDSKERAFTSVFLGSGSTWNLPASEN